MTRCWNFYLSLCPQHWIGIQVVFLILICWLLSCLKSSLQATYLLRMVHQALPNSDDSYSNKPCGTFVENVPPTFTPIDILVSIFCRIDSSRWTVRVGDWHRWHWFSLSLDYILTITMALWEVRRNDLAKASKIVQALGWKRSDRGRRTFELFSYHCKNRYCELKRFHLFTVGWLYLPLLYWRLADEVIFTISHDVFMVYHCSRGDFV